MSATHRRTAAAYVAVSALLVASLVLAAAGQASANDGTGTGLTADEIRFRQTFGFPTTALDSTSFTGSSLVKFGARLTRSEEADLDSRLVRQTELGPLVDLVLGHADDFGGIWLDQSSSHGHGFIVNVGTVDRTPPSFLETAKGLVPEGVDVRAVTVTHSARALEDAFERTLARTNQLIDDGVLINGIGIDTPNNRIIVWVDRAPQRESLTSEEPAVAIEMRERLRATACNPVERCTFLPYRGGLQILDPNPAFRQCTSGYWTKSPLPTTYYIVTAAHCDYAPASVEAFRSGPPARLGEWGIDSISGAGCGATCPANTETIRIRVDAALVPATDKNCLYENLATKCRRVGSVANWTNTVPGTAVCAVGVTSNRLCGVITRRGSGVVPVDRYSKLINVAKGIYTNFVMDGGDSGGPVYTPQSPAVAHGITSAVGGGETFASSVQWTLSDLGVSLCVSTGC